MNIDLYNVDPTNLSTLINTAIEHCLGFDFTKGQADRSINVPIVHHINPSSSNNEEINTEGTKTVAINNAKVNIRGKMNAPCYLRRYRLGHQHKNINLMNMTLLKKKSEVK